MADQEASVLQPVHHVKPYKRVQGIHQIERSFVSPAAWRSTLAGRFNVRGIPNFAVFNGGRLVMQQAGVVDHDKMKQWLSSAAAVSA